MTRPNTDNSNPLTVRLISDDITEADVPATVTIDAGQPSATFTVTASDDNLLDGTQAVTIWASADGYQDGQQALSVTDLEPLTLTVAPATIAENAGTGAATGTVSRNSLTGENLLVTHEHYSTNQHHLYEYTTSGVQLQSYAIPYGGGTRAITERVRDTVPLPDGQIAVYDGTFDPYLAVLDRTDSSWHHATTEDWSTANDDSYGGIAVAGDYVFLSDMETVGDEPQGIVRFDTRDDSALRFATAIEPIDLAMGLDGLLYALDQNEYSVTVFHPATLAELRSFDLSDGLLKVRSRAIAVNAAGVIFTASWDDHLYQFNSNGAVMDSLALGVIDPIDIDISSEGIIAVGSRFGTVVLTDERLAVTRTFSVGAGTTFVSFVAAPIPATTVSLTNGDASEIGIPPSVALAAGHLSAAFAIDAVDDGIVDDTQTVAIRASAAGYTDSTDTLDVTDAGGTWVIEPADWTAAELTLVRDGNQLHVYRTGTTTDAVTPVSIADATAITITARDGQDDTLTVDFSGGNPIPAGGLSYEGGSGGNDTLALIGGTFTTTTYTFASESAGSIDLDGSSITYTGLEPISSTIAATNVTLNYSTTAETITITDATGGQTTVDSDVAGEVVTLNNPTGTLTINAGDTGNDIIDIASLAADFPAHIMIDGQGDSDTLHVNGRLSLSRKDLTVSVDTIDVNATVATGGGEVSLSATGDVTFNAMVWADGGDLTVHADSDGDGSGTFSLLTQPGAIEEQAILHASDAEVNDNFGYSVAIAGDTAIVGAYAEDGGTGPLRFQSGAAYVFTRDAGGAWTEQAILRASDAQSQDYFGYSVAISGDTAIVGAYHEDGGAGDPLSDSGAAYVFSRDAGGVWTEQAILHASDAEATDTFGYSVSISGDTAIVGTFYGDAAYVFARDGDGAWREQAILHASDGLSDDYFGNSVSISGDTVIVGARLEDGSEPFSDKGAAYVFRQVAVGIWIEEAILHASDGQEDDYFGTSVSISGNRVVVGAPGEDGGVGDPFAWGGAAYVFSRDVGGVWTEQTVLRASDAQGNDYFGQSVSISGENVIVGAPSEDGGLGDPRLGSGAAYAFTRDGSGTWVEREIIRASDARSVDEFGCSVSMSGDTVIVGAYREDGGPTDPIQDSGAAYLFLAPSWVDSGAGDVSITAADVNLAGRLVGHGDLAFVPSVASRSIGLGGGAGDFHLDDSELAKLTDGFRSIVIGDSVTGTGAVDIDSATFPYPVTIVGGSIAVTGLNGGTNAVVLTARTGAISDGGDAGIDVTASTLVATASTGIGPGALETEVSQLEADGGAGGVTVANAGDLAIGSVTDTLTGVAATNAAVTISAAGSLTVDEAINSGGGDVSLSATGDVKFRAMVQTGGGSLTVHADSDGDGSGTFSLVAESDVLEEQAILHAADAQIDDLFGRTVSISGDTAIVGAYQEDGGASGSRPDAGAAYVFTRDAGGVWTQQAVLHASNAEAGDFFGYSVSVSGETAIVGAYREDGGTNNPLTYAGAAYVFTRNAGGVWTEQAVLRASDAQFTDYFGKSVSISGDTVVVGADSEDGGAGDPRMNSGAAYVFVRDGGGVWTEQAILRASDAQNSDSFGESVSISGDSVIVGARLEDGGSGNPAFSGGAAYVFTRDGGGVWSQQSILRASDKQSGDFFGWSVAISGDRAIVGAPNEDGGAGNPVSGGGAAYVFERNAGGMWTEQAILHASDPRTSDDFGIAVAISGERAIVGSHREDGGAGDPLRDSGAAYVFLRGTDGTWIEQMILRAPDAQSDDYFGTSVSLSGDSAIVGALYEDGGAGDPLSDSGAAYMYQADIAATGEIAAAAGSVSITAADLDLRGQLSGTGSLHFVPSVASRTIGVGGGSGDFGLDDAELNNLTDGFSSIAIGDATVGTGSVDIDSATLLDPITIAGGTIHDHSGTDITAPSVTLDGNVSPGQSPGLLAVDGNMAFASGSMFTVEINGVLPGTDHDQLSVLGNNRTITLNNTDLVLAPNSAPAVGSQQEYRILDSTGSGSSVVGNFRHSGAVLNDGDTFTVSSTVFRILYNPAGSPGDVLLTEAANVAPSDIALSNDRVPENTDTSGGLVIGLVTGTDPNPLPPDNTLALAVHGGADAGKFHLDASNNLVLTDGVLNFEAPTDANADGVYEVTLRATDGGTPKLVYDEAFSILVTDVDEDFGDAPTAALSGLAADYPTTNPANGAYHVAVGPVLGVSRDAENNGIPDAAARGDDSNNVDDEDGVAFPTPWIVGQLATIEVTASDDAVLDAWIDFNADGDWADDGEKVFAGKAVTGGTQSLDLPIPANLPPASTYARFRLSSAGVASYQGFAADGEVEDYAVSIQGRLTVTIDELSVAEDGSSITVAVTRTDKSGDLNVTLSGDDGGELTVPSSMLIPDGQYSATATVTPRADLTVDGTQTVTVTASADGYVNGTDTIDVTDTDLPGFTLSKTTVSVSEDDTMDTFTVVLNAKPLANVVFDVTSGTPGEATVSPATLTFSPDAWNQAQTVTVTGVNDSPPTVDGSQAVTVTVAVNDAGSDNAWDDLVDQTVAATNADNDSPGFTLSKTTVNVSEDETTDTFTVVLNAKPLGNVVFDVASGTPGEATVSPATLTFSPDVWNVAQTVTITGVNDSPPTVDGSQTVTVTVAVNDHGSDNAWDDLADQTVTATNADNDLPRFTLSKTTVNVSEDETTDTFTVVLNAKPLANVVFDVASVTPGEATVSLATLTFSPDDWNETQTVTITGVNDAPATVDGAQAVTITVAVNDAGSDSAWDNLADQTVMATNADNDAPGFTLSKTAISVSENATTETFTVVLDAKPLSDVVFDVTSGTTAEAAVDKATLTFTPSNWNQVQTVMVTGVNDSPGTVDGDQAVTITVAVNDAGSDNAWDDLADQTITASNADNDLPGFTLSKTAVSVSENATTDTFTVVLDAKPLSDVVFDVASGTVSEATVDKATLTFTPANWDQAQTVTVTGVNDTPATVDGDQGVTITVAVNDAGSDNAWDDLADQTVTATNADNDTPGYTLSKTAVSVSENATIDTFTVVLNAKPLSDVVFDVSSGTVSEATVDKAALTFTPANWDQAQTVTVTGVNDTPATVDGAQAVTITVAVNDAGSDNAWDNLADQTVTATNADNDSPGFTLSKTAVSVSEDATTDTFTVVLDAKPLSNVVVDVTSGTPGEATVDKATLTFTPANWDQAQAVTVTGVNDAPATVDGAQAVTITVAVNDDGSNNAWDDLADQTITASNADNDLPGFTLSKTAVSVSENATTDTFTVVLDAKPLSDVVFDVASGTVSEATVDKATLTFTPANWDQAQTVTVTGVNDTPATVDGDQGVTITVAVNEAGSDNAWDNLADQTVTATNADNDAPGFTLSKTGLSVSENVTTETFTVVLNAKPLSDVVFDVTSGTTGEATVDKAALTFTPATWDQAQTVTVTGVNDAPATVDGAQAVTITVAVNDAGSDNAWDNLADQTVTATNADNDSPGFTLSKTAVSVSEDATTDTFTMVLHAKPLSNVVFDVTSGTPGEATVDKATLTFTPANWDQSQTVTVTGVNDTSATVDGDQAVTIRVAVNDAGSDNGWDDLADQMVAATNADNDSPGFTLSKTTVSVSEDGTTDTFTVTLHAKPLSDVLLSVVVSDETESTVDKATLTFTPGNWEQAQTVTVIGVDDFAVDGTQTIDVSITVAAENSDDLWDGLPAQVVTVEVTDHYRWQSFTHPCDVNADGKIEPLDVLSVINEINSDGSRELPVPYTAEDSPPYYWDASGDGSLGPIDVLEIINYINANGSGPVPAVAKGGESGEGEAAVFWVSESTGKDGAGLQPVDTRQSVVPAQDSTDTIGTASPSPDLPCGSGSNASTVDRDIATNIQRVFQDLAEDWTSFDRFLEELLQEVVN